MTLKTYNAEQVAGLLFVHENRVLELAASGELPGVKVGRSWVFMDTWITEYLERKRKESSMGCADRRSRRRQQSPAAA